MIGYNTINKTIGTLYLGASDTTTNRYMLYFQLILIAVIIQ